MYIYTYIGMSHVRLVGKGLDSWGCSVQSARIEVGAMKALPWPMAQEARYYSNNNNDNHSITCLWSLVSAFRFAVVRCSFRRFTVVALRLFSSDSRFQRCRFGHVCANSRFVKGGCSGNSVIYWLIIYYYPHPLHSPPKGSKNKYHF